MPFLILFMPLTLTLPYPNLILLVLWLCICFRSLSIPFIFNFYHFVSSVSYKHHITGLCFLIQFNSIKFWMRKFSLFTSSVKTVIFELILSFSLELTDLEKFPLPLPPLIVRCSWSTFCLMLFVWHSSRVFLLENGWWHLWIRTEQEISFTLTGKWQLTTYAIFRLLAFCLCGLQKWVHHL